MLLSVLVSQNESAVLKWKCKTEINAPCFFIFSWKLCYTCHIQTGNYTDDSDSIEIDRSLSDSGKTYSDIRNVDFSGIVVSFIPTQVFKAFPGLMVLSIDEANLREILPNSFTGASELTYIYGYSNKVTALGPNSFAGASKMELINMHNNRINTIHILAFSGLSKLKYLYLNGNNIVYIDYRTFYGLTNLIHLHLSKNKLVEIDLKTFSKLKKLEILLLESNSCINQNYTIINEDFKDVESSLLKTSCISQVALNDLSLKMETDKIYSQLNDSINLLEKSKGKLLILTKKNNYLEMMIFVSTGTNIFEIICIIFLIGVTVRSILVFRRSHN